MENRRHPRIPIKHLVTDVNDGIGFFQGKVSNISRYGICISDLPRQIDVSAQSMMVIISLKEHYFRLFVRPKWCLQVKRNKTVGTEIINIPWSWKEFVIKHEPLSERDVSDLIHRIHQRQRQRDKS